MKKNRENEEKKLEKCKQERTMKNIEKFIGKNLK